MSRNLRLPVLLLVVTASVLSSCKKLVHQNITAASNSSVAIRTFNDVFVQLNAAADSALDSKTMAQWVMNGTVCADVSLQPLGPAFPKTLTIDYGSGCLGFDGIQRSGKIIAVFSGNLLNQNTTINISFDTYRTGQYLLAGTDSITHLGTDAEGHPMFSEVIRDARITLASEQIRWNAQVERTWLEGDTTSFTTDTTGGTLGVAGLLDDSFALVVHATGNDSNTHPFSLETITPLLLRSDCRWITEGTLTISPVNFNSGTVDYGPGTCDKQATLEVEGELFNFTQ